MNGMNASKARLEKGTYTQEQLAQAERELLESGDVLWVGRPDEEPLRALREDLDAHEYPKKFKEYAQDILNVISMPIIKDRFSDDPLRHAERREWRESLSGAQKHFAEHSLLRAHKLGHAVVYLEALLHLSPVPESAGEDAKMVAAFLAAQARDKNVLFAKESADMPSEYEKKDFEEKREAAESIRDFLKESLQTLLPMYRLPSRTS